MITNDKKLKVFENFFIDENLKKKIKKEISYTDGSVSMVVSGGNSFPTNGVGRNDFVLLREYLEYKYSQNSTIINWLKLKFATTFISDKKIKKGVVKFQSVDDFFKNIHNTVKELELDPKSIEFYAQAIKNAVDNGQTALSEILVSKRDVILRELKLLKFKKIQYVDEQDVVEFFEKSKVSDKFLKLTWMKNYTRVIPNDVLEEKRKFDEQELFDNCVILHFDINDDASEMTEKEKEKAKDPILFGVFRGSRKLYFVGDWIDEYCDLTLDKFIKTLEQEKIKELSQEIIEKEILK